MGMRPWRAWAPCPQHRATALTHCPLPASSPTSTRQGGFSVFAGVGERTREGNDLYREMIESGGCWG
jgi:hypothetical protein